MISRAVRRSSLALRRAMSVETLRPVPATMRHTTYSPGCAPEEHPSPFSQSTMVQDSRAEAGHACIAALQRAGLFGTCLVRLDAAAASTGS